MTTSKPSDYAHWWNQLAGNKVSHIWFGDYSSLYLEIGNLKMSEYRLKNPRKNPRGEFTIYAGFQWRVERPRSIAGGSYSSRTQWVRITNLLLGQNIVCCSTIGRIPELAISFTNGLWLVTTELDKGQPGWSVTFPGEKTNYLCCTNGKVQLTDR